MGVGIFLLLLCLVAGYLLRYRSVEAVEQLVSNLSNGEYKLRATSFKFNLFKFQINAKNIEVSPTNLNDDNSLFEFKADSLSINVNNPIQLLLFKRLSVNRLILKSPYLELRTQKKDSARIRPMRPLHIEIAAVQDVFFDVLSSLEVQQFKLTDGSVSIYPETDLHNRRFFMNHINLALDDLHLLRKIKQWDNTNRVSVDLQLIKPIIEYPDSSLQVVLDKLIWQSKKRRFELSGLDFHKRMDDYKVKSGFRLENIDLDSLNWNKLLTEGKIELGLLKAAKGYFTSNDIRFKANPNKQTVRVDNSFLDILGPIRIKKLEIDSIEFTGTTIGRRGKEKLEVFGDNFLVSNLIVDNDLPNKIELDDLEFAVRGFLQSDSSKSFQTGFDGMRIKKNQLTLRNYFLRAMNRTQTGSNTIEAKQLILHNLSIPALLNGRLQSEELYLMEPNVRIELSAEKNTKNAHPIQELQRTIRRKLQIETIRIFDANLVITQGASKTPLLQSDSFSAIISSNSVLRAGTLEQLFGGSNRLAMPKLKLRLKNINIDLTNAVYENNNLTAEKAIGLSQKKQISFNLNNIQITDINAAGILVSKDTNWIRIVQLGSGKVTVTMPEASGNKGKTVTIPQDMVRMIRTGKLDLQLRFPEGSVSTTVDTLSIDSLRYKQKHWNWHSYFMTGRNLSLSKGNLQLSTDHYQFGSNTSTRLQNLLFSNQTNKYNVTASVPELEMDGSIRSMKEPLAGIKQFRLKQPNVDLLLKEAEEFTEETESKKELRSLPALQLTSPVISIKKLNNDSVSTLFSSEGGHLFAAPVNIEKGVIATKEIDLSLHNIIAIPHKMKLQAGVFSLKANNFLLDKTFETNIQKIVVNAGQVEQQTDAFHVKVDGIEVVNKAPIFFSSRKEDLKKMLENVPSINLRADQLSMTKGNRKWEIIQPDINADQKTIGFDSIQFTSLLSKDSFFKQAPYQTDFIEFTAGKSRIMGFDREINGVDTLWKANRIELNQFYLNVDRDKRLPLDSIQYRPLLADMIRKIPIHLQVGSALLTDSRIQYNEISGKNGKQGSVWFGDLTLVAGPIKNYQLTPRDSFKITAMTRFMDQGSIKFAFQQSYLDSLKGFLLLARMGKMELNALSPLLLPLFNLNIKQGFTDSLWLRVKGNDHFAYGHMELDYKKLKFELLNEEGKKKKMTSFLANLLIKNRNDKKGLVYQARLQNKSTFNFWGKIALSGLLTNMGVKSDKKYIRKYKKEAKKLQIPSELFQ